MKATATANANIALVKYWGKRDNALILPQNSSLSMTCDGLSTVTTVEFSGAYRRDVISINDEELQKDEKNVISHLDKVRTRAGITAKAKVVSRSNFPVAAGLASSASGFAALTVAACAAAGLALKEKELSILARQGSGSACRSICEGFAVWHRGTRVDGTDSYATSIAPKEHWPEFRVIAAVVSTEKKKTSSRAGMTQTVATSPYYAGWLKGVEGDLENIRQGIKRRDFTAVGSVAEANCLKMHALMMTTTPALIYWIPETVAVMQAVMQWRDEGTECYFTIDAGPQVKVLCLEKDQKRISSRLHALRAVRNIIVCRPGSGAQLLTEHLF